MLKIISTFSIEAGELAVNTVFRNFFIDFKNERSSRLLENRLNLLYIIKTSAHLKVKFIQVTCFKNIRFPTQVVVINKYLI